MIHGTQLTLTRKLGARIVVGEDLRRLAPSRRTGNRAALRVLLADQSLIDQQRTAHRSAHHLFLHSTGLSVDARKALTNSRITTRAG